MSSVKKAGLVVSKDVLWRFSDERIARLAKRLNIDSGARSKDQVLNRAYEILNGLPPQEDAFDDAAVFENTASSDPAPDLPPEDALAEDQKRRRLFILAAEILGPGLMKMREAEAKMLLSWCPTLPNGEAADCHLCPRAIMLRCWDRHRSLLV